MSAAMEKTMAGLALRLWTPRTARVKFVKQVAPTIEDLTARRTESCNLRGDYPLGGRRGAADRGADGLPV